MSYPFGISEIVLLVEDVAVTRTFYKNVVGLQLCDETAERSNENPDWAWFWVGDATNKQRLALHKGSLLFEEHSPFPEGQRFGKVHFALHVAKRDLTSAVERVRKSGCAVYGPVELEWMNAQSYYFYDPAGNLLEFWSPYEDK